MSATLVSKQNLWEKLKAQDCVPVSTWTVHLNEWMIQGCDSPVDSHGILLNNAQELEHV